MVFGLAEKLKEQRTLMGLSQKEVAYTLDVSASIISNYESGERTPSVEALMSLARLYHCSTDYLLGFEKPNISFELDVSMLNKEQLKGLQHFLLLLCENHEKTE